MKVKKVSMGTFLDKGDIIISKFIQNCVKCNVEERKKYEVGKDPVYSGLATIAPPMSQEEGASGHDMAFVLLTLQS